MPRDLFADRPAAASSGPRDLFAQPSAPNDAPSVGALTASTLAGGQALSLGFGDEIGAALFSPLEVAIGAVSGEDDGRGLGERFSAAYDRGLDKRRALFEKAEEEHPVASTVGAIGAGLGAAGPLARAPQLTGQALGLGEGLAGRAAASALTGSGVGAVQGFGEGEGGLENRLKSAAIGGGMGAAVGGAIPVLAAGVGSGVRAVREQLQRGALPVAAQRMIVDDLAAEGTNLAEVGAKAKSLGPEAMLADTSDTLRLRAEQIAQSDNPGRAPVIAALRERSGGARDRIGTAFDGSLGERPNVQQTLDDMLTARSSASQPLYEKALSRRVAWDDRLKAFMDDPITKGALSRGVEIQRLEALADDVPFRPNDYAITGFNDAGDPVIGLVPNFRTMNVVKKGLDALVEENTNEFGKLTERGRALDGVRRSFLAKLDSMNPDYAVARQEWGGRTQAMKAFQTGREILMAKTHPDFLAADVAKMSAADRDALKLGVRAAIDEAMGRVRNGALKGRQLLDSDFNERKILTVLGEDEGKKLIAALNAEEAMAQTTQQALGNSATARRQDNPFRANGRTSGDRPKGVLRSAANLNFGDAAARVGEYGMSALDARARDNLGKALGPTLTAKGTARDALIEDIVQTTARRMKLDAAVPAQRALVEAILRGGTLAGGPLAAPTGSR